MKTCSDLRRVSITLYVLVIIFNLSSWIDLNGVWAELPFLVQSLPENWGLGSYITLATMTGLLVQWLFFFGNMYKPKIFCHVSAIYLIITIGFTSLILLIFFWRIITYVDGEPHSVAFLTLVASLSCVDHVSTVAFLAFMVILPSEYMSAYYVGDGMNNLIPSLLGLIQGQGDYDCVNITKINSGEHSNATTFEIKQVMHEPLYSVSVYFGLMAVILAGSGVAFSIIYYHPWGKKFHVRSIEKNEQNGIHNEGFTPDSVTIISYKSNVIVVEDKHNTSLNSEYVTEKNCENSQENEREAGKKDLIEKDGGQKMSTLETGFLLVVFGYLFGMRYGCLYTLQSYSLLPYVSVIIRLEVERHQTQ